MIETQKYFDENGYVVLSNVLNEQQAQELTQHMFKLHEEGKLVKDDQCPLSDAVYGDPVFDNLMIKLAEPLGNHLGRKLLPTYTYARIYRPGDVLKRHIDRPACEISATLTLGYDAKSNWPIFFEGKNKTEIPVFIEPGDLAMYKGTEMMHWRQPFKGNWHVQVFIHYVDANGPYADEAMDRRVPIEQPQNNVSVKPQQQTVNNNRNTNEIDIPAAIHNVTFIPDVKDNYLPGYFPINHNNIPELMFTSEECDNIRNKINDLYPSVASVGGDGAQAIAKEVRSAYVYNIENNSENRWIFDRVSKIISVANAVHFDYDVSAITHSLQLIHYPSNSDVKGHYNWHVDAGNGHMATRKISLTVQLSDTNDYTGCDLIVNDHGHNIQAVRDKGSISLFPSYMPHVVTPIETGDRYALVIWAHGSRRFK